MSEFDLDLKAAEDRMEGDWLDENRIVLGVLDGSTPAEEWIETVADGAVLVLAVEGDVNELAAGFAREVRDGDGDLMTFRDFLIVTPADVEIDHGRLG